MKFILKQLCGCHFPLAGIFIMIMVFAVTNEVTSLLMVLKLSSFFSTPFLPSMLFYISATFIEPAMVQSLLSMLVV